MSAQQICENIYTFAIVLPDNPLKWLNCYVIKSGAEGRNLLIDTGFKRRECLKPLLEGIKELGLMPENTDVFISHAHSDHAGNAGALENLGFRIMMGKVDYDAMLSPYWDRRKKRVISAHGLQVKTSLTS